MTVGNLERQPFSNYTPLVEDEREGEDLDGHGEHDEAACSGGCFRVFSCFPWQRREQRPLLGGGHGETWLGEKLRKVKEASEVVAGPKWKTFIRKISGYLKSRKHKQRVNYDAQSYALNFDSGVDVEDDGLPSGFWSRFSAPRSREES